MSGGGRYSPLFTSPDARLLGFSVEHSDLHPFLTDARDWPSPGIFGNEDPIRFVKILERTWYLVPGTLLCFFCECDESYLLLLTVGLLDATPLPGKFLVTSVVLLSETLEHRR